MNGPFWPWWWGGIAIGGLATLYPLLSGRTLGVSSLYAQLFQKRAPQPDLSELEAALLAETEAAFGPVTQPAPAARDRLAWLRADAERARPLFLLGMVLGPLVYAIASRQLSIAFSLGASFDIRYGEGGWVAPAVLLGSGTLIGFGTRLAGGCTSGHGISGVARGERGSLLTTLVFWSTALLVAWCFLWAGRR